MRAAVRDLLRSAYPAGDATFDVAMTRLCLRLKRESVGGAGEASPIDGAMPQMPNAWRVSTPMVGWP